MVEQVKALRCDLVSWDFLRHLCLVGKCHELTGYIRAVRPWYIALVFLSGSDSAHILVTQFWVVVREKFRGVVHQLCSITAIYLMGLVFHRRLSCRSRVLPRLLSEVFNGFSLHLEVLFELCQVDCDVVLALGVHQIFFRGLMTERGLRQATHRSFCLVIPRWVDIEAVTTFPNFDRALRALFVHYSGNNIRFSLFFTYCWLCGANF